MEAVGASGIVFTARGLATWYGTLRRPALVPPDWAFGPVLFALVGVAVWPLWRRAAALPSGDRRARVALGVTITAYLNHRFRVLN